MFKKLPIKIAFLLSIFLVSFKCFGDVVVDDIFYEHTVPEIESESDILLIGDSLGEGLSSRFKILAKQAGYKPHSRTIVGSNTHQWLKSLTKDLIKIKPKLVLISLGTNDSSMSEDWIEKHKSDYQNLVKIVTDSGSQVVWILPPKLNQKLKSQYKVRELIANTISLQFKSFELDIPQPKDGVHSTSKGYAIWMDEIWWWMEDIHLIYQGC